MRAIEQGLPLARAANTGISAMVDPFGRVVARLGLGEAGYVDARPSGCIAADAYARFGDLPGLTAIVIDFGINCCKFLRWRFSQATSITWPGVMGMPAARMRGGVPGPRRAGPVARVQWWGEPWQCHVCDRNRCLCGPAHAPAARGARDQPGPARPAPRADLLADPEVREGLEPDRRRAALPDRRAPRGAAEPLLRRARGRAPSRSATATARCATRCGL